MSVSTGSLARSARAILIASALGLAAAISLGGGHAAAATASTLPCTSLNQAGDASGFSLDCQVLDAHNDKVADLNAQAAFDLDDWVFASKYEIDERRYETAVRDLDFAIDGDEEGGRFSFDDGLWDDWSSAVILFKSASKKKGKKDDIDSAGNVVMFLVRPGVTVGDFARSLGKHGVSHVSLYLSRTDLAPGSGSGESPIPTPLPAPAMLLLGGMAGLGAVRARAGKR